MSSGVAAAADGAGAAAGAAAGSSSGKGLAGLLCGCLGKSWALATHGCCCVGTCVVVTAGVCALPMILGGGEEGPSEDRMVFQTRRTFTVDDFELTEDSLCGECQMRFARVICHDCVELYCATCCKAVHNRPTGFRGEHEDFEELPERKARYVLKKGRKKKDGAKPEAEPEPPKPKPLPRVKPKPVEEPEDPNGLSWKDFVPTQICGECETRRATKLCRDCMEVYCDECHKIVHGKGWRRNHGFAVPIWFKESTALVEDPDSREGISAERWKEMMDEEAEIDASREAGITPASPWPISDSDEEYDSDGLVVPTSNEPAGPPDVEFDPEFRPAGGPAGHSDPELDLD